MRMARAKAVAVLNAAMRMAWVISLVCTSRTVPDRGLPVSGNQSQPRPDQPVRRVPVEGTRLGPGALPLSDGSLQRHLAVAEGVRERQPSRTADHQALGL